MPSKRRLAVYGAGAIVALAAVGALVTPPKAPAPLTAVLPSVAAASATSSIASTPAPTATSTPTQVPTPSPSLSVAGDLAGFIEADDCEGLSSYVGPDAVNASDWGVDDLATAIDALERCLDSGSTTGPRATPAPVAAPVTVKGSGDRKTAKFSLADGDYKVVVRGNCTDSYGGNVAAVLYAVDGNEYVDLIVNELVDRGRFSYDNIEYGLTAGKYYLDMTICGSWTVTFSPSV